MVPHCFNFFFSEYSVAYELFKLDYIVNMKGMEDRKDLILSWVCFAECILDIVILQYDTFSICQIGTFST